ncbi:DUF6443 domain-containing protein [Sinomicrobium kalidii]|uniref:DUF6443 domain-containing protein n=1 Tax=Sinomicrobium kalidii TaxID=2900738 RepID=UPI001E3FDC09|nr:DUF6443 domain-containing protein [Sinomicrobium kalidii]UGU17912.1 DUF6443 domain-containing protein [Sinomicrobium kalidii]
MRKNTISTLLFLIACFSTFPVLGQEYEIMGPDVVSYGTTHTYSLVTSSSGNPPGLTNINWQIGGGTLQHSVGNGATIKWDGGGSSGSIFVTFSGSGSSGGNIYFPVQITDLPKPSAPPNPYVSNTGCGEVTLSRTGTPPNGTYWYWQGKNANGTSKSDSRNTYKVTSSGTYYIRAYNSTGWSNSSGAVSVTVPDNIPGVPSAPGITSNCDNVTLTRGTPPSGVTWYWQSSPGGTSTSNSSVNVSFEENGTYYLKARNNSSGCWSAARTINYTISGRPGIPAAPTITNDCELTTLTRGTPPGGVTWYWQSSSGGTSVSNSAVSVSFEESGVYYLRARNSSSGCWSTARTVNYTVTQKKTWYADNDEDGFGDPADTKQSCTQPDNYIAQAGDNCPGTWGENSGCPDASYTSVILSDDENYIYTRSYQKGMTTPEGVSENRDVMESVVYYDGLGRPKQEVSIRQSPRMQDVVRHIGYDAFGREDKEYLPFVPSAATGSYGSFRTGDIALQTQKYYKSGYVEDFDGMTDVQANAYSQKQFEASPLNRVEKQAAPGKDWKLGNGHEIEFDYDINTANEVRRYEVNLTKSEVNTVITYIPALELNTNIDNGYYKTGELYKTVTYDENHETGKDHTTEEFKDKQGRVVLRRTYNNEQKHDTYYVYDDYGNLTYVLSPKAGAHSAKPDATKLEELCYQYVYDNRNRQVEKKLPGKGWEEIVYNTLDQPVLTRDANLKTKNQWLFTKYDALGRVAYTGVKNTTESREALQKKANLTSAYKQYVARTETVNNYANTPVYYSNVAIPTAMDEIHTINYYDTYVATAGLSVPATVYGKSKKSNPTGLPTVNKTRVLGTDHWITSITGYDKKGRVIYTASKNPYLNTTDIVEYKPDFTGKVLESRTTHTRGSNPAIVTVDKFEYDHSGRLIRQLQCINGDCGGDTTGENPVFDDALTETQHEIASNSITLKPGFHFKATSSISFSASISPAGELIAENVYDDLGQLIEKKVGNTPGKPLQTINYAYNVRGWLKEINKVDAIGGDLFAFQIHYNSPAHSTSEPLFNGNISQVNWETQSDNKSKFWYIYHYDALNRITDAQFAGGGYWDRYSLHGVTYDKNGNINILQRKGHVNSEATSFGAMDNLSYDYNTGNKLLKVTDNANKTYGFKDGGNTGDDYTYDPNGNLTSDANKGITGVTYNHLNLPAEIKFNNSGTKKINYFYGADGVKLKKVVNNGGNITTTDYDNGYIYENGSLAFFSHPEGYVTKENNTYKYVYQYKDHIGNVRLSYTNTGTTSAPQLDIIQENNYYPGGLLHQGYNNITSSLGNSTAKKFKYQGQEYSESLGLNLYEFDLRHYSPTLMRFHTPDPYEQFMSPYVAMGNNPVVAYDPDGGKCFDPEGNEIVCPDENIYDDFRDSDTQNITVLDGVTVTPSEETTPNISQGSQLNSLYINRGRKIAPAITELSGWRHLVAEVAENLQGYRVEQGPGGNYHVDDQGKVIIGPYLGGLGAVGLIGGGPKKIPKFKLNTNSITRRQAFRKAKAVNKVPRSKQPDRVFNVREKGTGKLLKVYEYTNSSGKKILIRGDNAKIYKDGGIQGRHFNAGQKGGKLKQHHYYDN